jgi:hypothetical protein
MLGRTMGVRSVLADVQLAVVLQDARKHVARLARRAGYCLCGVDTVLVGGVGVESQRPIVIAEVAWIEAAQQAVALHGKALTVGG